MAKVFVGNFSFSASEDQIKEYFSQVGEVTAVSIMKDPVAGRSRGFGFVEFPDAQSAEKAIKELDGQVWEGRALKVSEDRSGKRFESGSSHDEGRPAPAPMGFFRAQPLDLGIRKKKKTDPFTDDPQALIDYKDAKMLSRYMSERGRILPRRMTGLTAHNQRVITRAIKRARNLGILPFTSR
jgi:small subunit ribosomal protein S18